MTEDMVVCIQLCAPRSCKTLAVDVVAEMDDAFCKLVADVASMLTGRMAADEVAADEGES